eukprot:6006356-Karenia_brevis.AAC.1
MIEDSYYANANVGHTPLSPPGVTADHPKTWLGTSEGQCGLVETKLRSYGEIRGLVFGAFADASPASDWLLDQVASLASERRVGARAFKNPEDERVML